MPHVLLRLRPLLSRFSTPTPLAENVEGFRRSDRKEWREMRIGTENGKNERRVREAFLAAVPSPLSVFPRILYFPPLLAC